MFLPLISLLHFLGDQILGYLLLCGAPWEPSLLGMERQGVPSLCPYLPLFSLCVLCLQSSPVALTQTPFY